jgi:hypothetical protein
MADGSVRLPDVEVTGRTPASRYAARAIPRAIRVLACALGWACATQSPALQPTAAPALAPAATPQPTSSLGARARLLPHGATFADVVDAARALDAAGRTQSDAGCLFATAGGPRLAADLLIAAPPLPDPPEELAASLLKAAGPAAVLTGWGSSPGELPEVALAAFTTTSPASARAAAVSLFLTARGAFVRGAAMPLRARPEALELQVAAGLLAQVPDPAVVYVSAEAAISLERLIEALRSVPNRLETALAVALPKGTRLPPPAARGSELLCPDGLPEPSDDELEGELEPAALRDVLLPIRERALQCALSTGGTALQGGRMELGLRIGKNGRPLFSCMVSDSIGELVLCRCVIEVVRALQFPAPNPSGFVDVQLPLELAIAGPERQRPLCE